MDPTGNKLKFRTKFAYGVGHVLNDLCASMWFSYLLLYLHRVLGFSNNVAGVLLLIGQVADALSTPFVGIESDRTDDFWLCRYGRRKTWHLVGTVCVVCSFPFLFIQCIGCRNASEISQVIYYAAFIIIFQFGWASVQISHLALIPDLTDDPNERTELNAIRYAFTVISNVCVYVITWVVLGVSNTSHSSTNGANNLIGPEDAFEFRSIVLIVVGLGITQSIVFHLGVHEKRVDSGWLQIQESSISINDNGKKWKDWFTSFQFYMVALLYMCTRLFVNLSQVYIPLYLQDSLQLDEKKVAIIPLIMFISGFLLSFVMKPLNKHVGRKVTYFLGVLFGVASCVWLYFGSGDFYIKYELYAVAAFLGAGGSTMLITSLSITADLIGGNTGSSAFVYGTMSFTDKLANGIAIVVVQDLHPCDNCCSGCEHYYKDVIALGCGSAALVALASLIAIRTLTLSVNVSDPSDHVYESLTNESTKDEIHHNTDDTISA